MKVIIKNDKNGFISMSKEEWKKIGEKNGWDVLIGGRGDGKDVEDVAKKHNVTVDQINNQLDIGMKVEKEHTDNSEIQKEISIDHLSESPVYYDLLIEMEKKFDK